MLRVDKMTLAGYRLLVYITTMNTAKLFTNGRSQAVRLPKEFRFEGSEVIVTRLGSAVVLLPREHSWNVLFEAVDGFTDDFMTKRDQAPVQHRDLDFEV